MAYLIIFIFVIVCALSYIEDRLPKKQTVILFAFLGVCLIFMAGLKEIGIDPDSINYENSYHNYSSDKTSDNVEMSFIVVSTILNFITDDAHALFLFYAFWGVLLKFIAFHKLNSSCLFLSLVVYLSYFYEVHEMMQIRTGILSGCFLLAVKEIGDKKRLKAFIYILAGTLFHVSGLLLLFFLFFKNNRLSNIQRIVWVSLVLLALITSVGGDGMLGLVSNIPYVGDKLAIYQKAVEIGTSKSTINGLGIFHLMSVSLFMLFILFSDLLTERNKYFPLLIKIYAIGLMAYTVLGFVPELGERVSYLLRIVTIPLYVTISYTVVPKWVGILLVEIIALIYLNYGLHFIDFDLLWKTAG